MNTIIAYVEFLSPYMHSADCMFDGGSLSAATGCAHGRLHVCDTGQLNDATVNAQCILHA